MVVNTKMNPVDSYSFNMPLDVFNGLIVLLKFARGDEVIDEAVHNLEMSKNMRKKFRRFCAELPTDFESIDPSVIKLALAMVSANLTEPTLRQHIDDAIDMAYGKIEAEVDKGEATEGQLLTAGQTIMIQKKAIELVDGSVSIESNSTFVNVVRRELGVMLHFLYVNVPECNCRVAETGWVS